MNADILDHIDNMAGNIDRTRVITEIVSIDMAMSADGEPRRMADAAAASLLLQIEKNLEDLGSILSEMSKDYRAETRKSTPCRPAQ